MSFPHCLSLSTPYINSCICCIYSSIHRLAEVFYLVAMENLHCLWAACLPLSFKKYFDIVKLVSYYSLNSYFVWSFISSLIFPYQTMIYSINSWPATPTNPFLRFFLSSRNSGKTAKMISVLMACWKLLQVIKLN